MGPGRTVKQEQEEISRNHVQTFISSSVRVGGRKERNFGLQRGRAVKKAAKSLTHSKANLTPD